MPLGPSAGDKVASETCHRLDHHHRVAVRERGDGTSGVGVEVGGRSPPVGAAKPVGAVGGDRNREDAGDSEHEAAGGKTVLSLPDGSLVEVFTETEPDHQHFTTGPVAGFAVEDVGVVRSMLEESGTEFCGPTVGDGTYSWAHFRAPDGRIYEISGPSKPPQR